MRMVEDDPAHLPRYAGVSALLNALAFAGLAVMFAIAGEPSPRSAIEIAAMSLLMGAVLAPTFHSIARFGNAEGPPRYRRALMLQLGTWGAIYLLGLYALAGGPLPG